jgi:hypothetical protein
VATRDNDSRAKCSLIPCCVEYMYRNAEQTKSRCVHGLKQNKPDNAMMRQSKVTSPGRSESDVGSVRNRSTEDGCCLLRARISAHLGRYNCRCFRRPPIRGWRGCPCAYRTSVLFKISWEWRTLNGTARVQGSTLTQTTETRVGRDFGHKKTQES